VVSSVVVGDRFRPQASSRTAFASDQVIVRIVVDDRRLLCGESDRPRPSQSTLVGETPTGLTPDPRHERAEGAMVDRLPGGLLPLAYERECRPLRHSSRMPCTWPRT
jgi:hypothetical protein